MNQKLKIITVGGGKGGVGKSVLCTNMAAAMALSGMEIVLADTDYGASNLHGMLGITNPKYGFQDFFNKDALELDAEEMLMETGVGNLKFLSGAGDLPGSANISSEHMNRIMESIRKIDTDMVFLDLAPGNGFNTVDLFNAGDTQIAVTTPEMTSVMNTFSFIKAALFRRLSEALSHLPAIHDLLDYSTHPGSGEDSFEINKLRLRVLDIDKDSLVTMNSIINNFKPSIVVNRVRRKKDVLMGDNLVQLAKKYLEIDINYLGYVIESDKVRDSVEEMIPFLIKDPASKPSANLQQIVSALTNTDIHLVKKDGAIFVSKQVRLSSGWGS